MDILQNRYEAMDRKNHAECEANGLTWRQIKDKLAAASAVTDLPESQWEKTKAETAMTWQAIQDRQARAHSGYIKSHEHSVEP